MALSPLAALSLPLATSPDWQAGAASFADRVRASLTSEGAGKWWRGLDERMTFMEWTWDAFGVDLSYVWDPDLWMKLKTAVRWGGAS
jgi:cell division protease FtsH